MVGLGVEGAHLELFNLVVLQEQLLQLLHLVEGVEGNIADVVVAHVKLGDRLQGLERDIGQIVEVESVPENQLLQGLPNLPKGRVLDPGNFVPSKVEP